MTREEAIDLIEGIRHGSVDALGIVLNILEQEPTVTSTDEPMTMVYPTIVCDDVVSRDAVIDTLSEYVSLEEYEDKHHTFTVKPLIKRIVKLPSVTQKPIECEDAVSRDELLKAIDTWDKFGYTETGCFVREPKGDYVPYIHYDDVIKCIKGMPPVTQKSDKYRKEAKRWKNKWLKSQKSGKWIALENRFELGDRVKCSECGQVFVVGDDVSRNYCPNCGARMVEPQERSERGMKSDKCVKYKNVAIELLIEYLENEQNVIGEYSGDFKKSALELKKQALEYLKRLDEGEDTFNEIVKDMWIVDYFKAESEDKE